MNARVQFSEEVCELSLHAEFPVKFQPLFIPKRYKVFYGGRGSAKSWQFARALLLTGAERKLRILCARELQISIKDSVHHLLETQIEKLGLSEIYDVNDTEITCKLTGTVFIFKGLRYNISSIKSFEDIDIVWVEEAQSVSAESWRELIPTIRNPGSEIWVSFNPNLPTDPTWKRFVESPPDDCIVVRVSFEDNPWFPEELRKEMEYDRRVDPDAAAHVWDGEFNVRNLASVFAGKWMIDVFETPTDAHGPYQGADWGFSQDPTVLTRSWIKDRKLFIEYEAYAVGCEIDNIPDLFDRVPMSRNYKIYADSARPETISHVGKRGFRIEPADKWKGSVEDGVTYLRSFEKIIIHQRCRHTAFEARWYSHKVDKLTGDPLPEIEDKHNHCWDSIRYAHDKLIRLSKSKGRPSVRSL